MKARFVRMNAYGAKAAALHLSYIERDGVALDGTAGRLYGPNDIDDARAALSSRIESERRQFRFIVSPEDGAEVDLTSFTRSLMSRMETDLGRPLVWGAVNHWNTDNPHVHVVIRGVDADGHDLTIDGRYMSEGLRARAQSILTNELGPRTEIQIRNQLAREVNEERFTSLDRVLQGCIGPSGDLLETWLASRDRELSARLVARVACLERMGLAARVSPVEWRFDARWAETLRGLGQATDIIERIHSVVPTADPSRFVILERSVELQPVDGVVRGKGLHDELSGQAFAVVEAIDGRMFYARIGVATAEGIREADVVRLSVVARDPAADIAAGRASRPHLQLQRLGPPIEIQRRYRGPTWLDTADAGKFPKPAVGLAAELAGALAQRAANIRAMGIADTDPATRATQLAGLEASTLGKRLAADRGLVHVEAAAGFEGTVSLSPRLPSGRQYVAVVDDSSKQLCVLLAHKALRVLDGKVVQLTQATDGRIIATEIPPRAPSLQR